MKSPFNAATFFAAQLSLAMLPPLMASAADAQKPEDAPPVTTLSPTQTAKESTSRVPPSTGIYDQYDRFKDSRGFPLPGYARVVEPFE